MGTIYKKGRFKEAVSCGGKGSRVTAPIVAGTPPLRGELEGVAGSCMPQRRGSRCRRASFTGTIQRVRRFHVADLAPPTHLRVVRHGRGLTSIVALLCAAFFVLATLGSTSAATEIGVTFPGMTQGRVWSIVVDPNSAGTLLAGTDNGVYRSTDGGTAWVQEGLTGVRVWTLAFQPGFPGVVFAGTDGQGVWASSNDGVTWTASTTGLAHGNVRVLALSSAALAAGTDNGVYLSRTGASWTLSGLTGFGISALAVTNASPFTLVAGIDQGPETNGFLFRSSNNGADWSPLESGLPPTASVNDIAVGPITQTGATPPVVAATDQGIYLSGDGGTTWTSGNPLAGGIILSTVAFDPVNPSVIYGGCDQEGAKSDNNGIWRSTNGGTNFSVLSSSVPATQQQVATIAVAVGSRPELTLGVDYPNDHAETFNVADTSAPAAVTVINPPSSTPLPVVSPPVTTATPTPTPSSHTTGTKHSGATPLPLRWPFPLSVELLVLVGLAYLVVWWWQRSGSDD